MESSHTDLLMMYYRSTDIHTNLSITVITLQVRDRVSYVLFIYTLQGLYRSVAGFSGCNGTTAISLVDDHKVLTQKKRKFITIMCPATPRGYPLLELRPGLVDTTTLENHSHSLMSRD